MSRYAVASLDTDFDARVRRALGATNGSVVGLSAKVLDQGASAVLSHLTEDDGLDVLALGPSIRIGDALELARRVDESHPEINVVLVSARPDPSLLESALRVGVRDVVDADADDVVLREALHRAARSAARRRSNLTGEARDGRGDRRVTVVVSPKGGSGKTMVSTNLAVGLAFNESPGSVALVDLDLTFGDTASALGLSPEHSLASAVQTLSRHDPLALKVHLTPHRSGLLTMCAPDRPEAGEAVTAEQSTEVVDLLGNDFRHVVVDTAAGLSEHTLAALEVATDVLLLCTMDVGSVRSLHKIVLALDELGVAATRHFVLNRAATRVGLDAADIEQTVGMPVDVAIPSHRSVPLSMNQGTPLMLERSGGRVRRALGQLVEHMTATTPAPAAPRLAAAGRR